MSETVLAEILGAGIAALTLALLLLPFLPRLAVRAGAFRLPVGRHVRESAVPRFGGLALFAAFALVVLLHPTLVLTRAIVALVGGLLILVVSGAADDLHDLPWWALAAAQLAAAACFVFGGGIVLDYVNAPFAEGAALRLDRVPFLSEGIAIIWLLAVVNAVNWLDGSDGIAVSVSGLALGVLMVLSLTVAVLQPPLAILASAGVGAALGFLLWNRPPAKIFLGSSGSYGLGFLIGGLALLAGAKLATAATVLLLPLADMAAVLTKRLVRRQSLTQGDRSHFHHILSARGMRPWAILFVYTAVAGAASAAALLLPRAAKSFTLLAGFLITWVALLILDWPRRKRQSDFGN